MVIAIIGVLVALLLPAVQAAREAARRAQCSNNLKQIGIGFQAYHAALGHFAPGWTEDNREELSDRGPNLSWGFHLLPYIEQAPLHQQFDQSEQAASGTPGGEVENIDLMGTPVESFRCPTATSPMTESIAGQGGFYPEIPEYAISNYVGSASSCEVCATGYIPDSRNGVESSVGCFETNPNSPLPFPIAVSRVRHNGVVFRNSNTPIKSITDGSSNTFIVGERYFGELIDPLLKRLRPHVGLVMYSLRGGEFPVHKKLYRSIRYRPTPEQREQGQREQAEILNSFDYRGRDLPATLSVSADFPVIDYFREFPGLQFGPDYNNAGFWDLPIPVCADVTMHPDDVVLYDNDGYPALREFLQKLNIRHILLTGYATDMCFCKTTAGYENLSKDFNVFLVGDATLATFPANITPKYATNAHISFASINQMITQTSWVKLKDVPENSRRGNESSVNVVK